MENIIINGQNAKQVIEGILEKYPNIRSESDYQNWYKIYIKAKSSASFEETLKSIILRHLTKDVDQIIKIRDVYKQPDMSRIFERESCVQAVVAFDILEKEVYGEE